MFVIFDKETQKVNIVLAQDADSQITIYNKKRGNSETNQVFKLCIMRSCSV